MNLEDLSDNTEQTKTPKTRSEYLHGKTELNDVDIIHILDLPVEKRSINNEIYTDKSYKELKNNPEELSSLTENLKTKPEYLKYHSSYIAKSKLLYQESDVLCNEIPCLMVLNQLKKTSYLLPYEYASNKSGAVITSADALKSNTFTDFKRVFNSRLKKLIEKGITQGKDIFFLINNKKLSHDEIKSQLIRFLNNRTSENKEGTYLFFSEKNFVCYSFESDKNGFITELPEYDLKEIRAAISSKPLTPSRESEKTSDSLASNLNITQEKSDVNELFSSLLLRGEITLLERKKDIENRNERYLDAVTSLEKLTPLIQSDSIKESNNKFVKKQKESRFYKDVQNLFVKTKTSNKPQEKTMENTSSENISYENEEMSKAAAIKERNQQKKLTTQMILDQEDKEQMESISATMKSATKDFMDLNATPITEERIDFLKTPTGNKSELSENEWKFSHSSEFKKLYGDWEGKIKKDFLLNDDTVSKLTGDEFSRKEGFTLTEQVEQYFNEMNNSVESPFFGKVVLDREGADDSLSHGMGRLKAVAYAGVPNVIKNGVIIDSDLNHKDRGYNSYVIAAPIKIADKNYICEVVLKQNKQENRFYLHEVTEQKKFLERAFVTNPAQKPAHQGTLSNILEKTVSVNYEISCPMGINGEPEKTFVQNEYRKSLDEFQSKNQNTAAKITGSVSQEENPFKNADPDQTKELYEQAEAVEKMQQEAAANAVLDENGNTHYQTDEELLQEYKQKYPESSLSISEDTRNELENVFSQIDDYLDKGIVPQERRFTLPKVSSYLKQLGSDETAISLPVSVIKKARETHGLSNKEIKNSLTRLYDPVAVFDTDKTKSENKLDSKLILTDEFSESKPIALALNTNTQIQVEENGHRKFIEVQDIRSIHDRTLTAKNGTDLVKHWTENGLCRYVDDKKISEWSTVARVSFPIEALHSDKNNILTKSEVVNGTDYQEIRTFSEFAEQQKAMEKEYQEYLGTISPDEESSRRIDSGEIFGKLENQQSKEKASSLSKNYTKVAVGVAPTIQTLRTSASSTALRASTTLATEETISQATQKSINEQKIKMPDQLVYAAARVGQVIEQRVQNELGIVNPTRDDRLSTISVPLNKEYNENFALSTVEKLLETEKNVQKATAADFQQIEPALQKKFDKLKAAIKSREEQDIQDISAAEEPGNKKKAIRSKSDIIRQAGKDFLKSVKEGIAPFFNAEDDFQRIIMHPQAIINASNGLPFSGESQLLAQIYHQRQRMEGEVVTSIAGAKAAGTIVLDTPESRQKNFALTDTSSLAEKNAIVRTRYFMPESCEEPDKIYAHTLQRQRPDKIRSYRDLIRHFENIPNGQKEISDIRIRIAHEHLKEIQSRFAIKEKRVLSVDEIEERKNFLRNYFERLPADYRNSERSAFEDTFGIQLNSEKNLEINLQRDFKDIDFAELKKNTKKSIELENRKLSDFIEKNTMEDKKLATLLSDEYKSLSKEEKMTVRNLKIEAIGIKEPETFLGKYLAACNTNAEFITDKETVEEVKKNLVKKLDENFKLEKYDILKEIGQQAQSIGNETTKKISFEKAHSNNKSLEKTQSPDKEISLIGMGK